MLLLTVVMLLQSPAQEDLPADCAKAMNTMEMNACAQVELEREEERMRRYLEAARKQAREADASSLEFGITPSQQVAYLQTTQTAWSADAETRCNGVWDQWKDGTIRTVMFIGCKIDATQKRTHEVWEDHLTYEDSTPPILPEPTGPASGSD